MTRTPIQIAVVLLVDRSGALLLQLRDAHAPVWPNVWCLPGGHVEHGEEVQAAAERELREESGLRADGGLHPFARQELSDPLRIKSYFYGFTRATQDDVVLGEGEAMVFVPADEVFAREFTPGTVQMISRFFASREYAGLARLSLSS